VTRTMRKLTDSDRILRQGRFNQRCIDCRLIRARILTLRADPNNITAKLIADELDGLVIAITEATK